MNPLLPVVTFLAVALLAAAGYALRALGQASKATGKVLQARSEPPPLPPAESPEAAPRRDWGPDAVDLPEWVRETISAVLPLRYVDFSLLGSGAMGTVVRSWDSRLERAVAIKIPPPHLSTRDEFRQRFLREARVLAHLNHENIARVFDVPEVPEGEVPLMIMEFLDGQDLSSYAKEHGCPPLAQVVDWVRQVGKALQVAHDKGVLHRDIKPANLFLMKNQKVKILDFGLAVMEDAARLTRTGARLGTLPYMPPEQLRGERVGPDADQYSLAASAFHLISGELPFSLEDRFRMTPPKLSARVPTVPRELDVVLARALSGLPEERYPSMKEFLAAMDFALEGQLG